MAKSKGSEGPRAPLFLLAALASCAVPAAADTVERAELERCAALGTAAEKLACFEALARAPEPGPEAAAEAAAAPSPGAPQEEPGGIGDAETAASDARTETPARAAAAEPAVQAALPAAAAAAAPSQEAPRSESVGPDPASAARTETPAPEPNGERGRDAAAKLPSEELGSEHLARPDEPAPEVVTATVERVEARWQRPLVFHFAGGQVWRQMEPGYFPYPKNRPFDVEIRRGMMGDYQLRVEGKGRMTRIVRVE